MAGLPTVTALLDDGTGTFPHDITSYVRLLDGISITAGREDEQSSPRPGVLTLSLNNSDGRFTPGSTVLGSPSRIVLNQRIRVKLTVGATTVNRFTGYVQDWTTKWPAGVTSFSTVEVTATDALARMGRVPTTTPLADVMILDGATLVYPLTDPQPAYTINNAVPACYPIGSYAEAAGPLWAVIESSEVNTLGFSPAAFNGVEMPNGNGSVVGQTTAGATFGTHPYFLGQYTSADVASGPNVAASSTYTIECAFKVPQSDTSERVASILKLGTLTTNVGLSFQISSAPSLESPVFRVSLDDGSGPVYVEQEADYADDKWHHAAMVVTNSGKTVTAYLDGVLVGAATAASSPAGNLDVFRVMYNAQLGVGDPVAAGYIAFTPAALTATQVATHAEVAVGSTGFRTDEVVERYADIANVPYTALDQGASRVPSFGGSDVAAIVAEVMNTERGRLYVDGSGTLTFEPRDYFLTDVYADTPDISGPLGLLAPDAYFPLDPQELVNRAEVTRNGGATIVREDATSITANGVYGNSQTIQAMTDADAANLAAYLLWLYADPAARLSGAKINLYGKTAAIQDDFLINLMGAWLRLTGLPSTAPTGATADQYIEGFTERINDSEWSLSVNTTAKLEEQDTWWRLNDANFPLGTNTHPFY